jgi:hypothetical protein
MTFRWRWIGLLLILILILISQSSLQADEGEGTAAFLQGTHVFRRILLERGLQPLATDRQIWGESAKKTLLIILGRPPNLSNPGSRKFGPRPPMDRSLMKFVENGGAILYASDHDWPPDGAAFTRDLATFTGYRIDGTVLLASADNPDKPTTFYRDPQCSVLRMIPGARPKLLGSLPLGPDDKPLPVATNRPSRLVKMQGESAPPVSLLLELPEGAHLEKRDRDVNPLEQQLWNLWKPAEKVLAPVERLFALSRETASGKLLLLADHSLFINAMMMPTDTANVEFTSKCLDYLCQGDEPRTHVLLVEDGQINSNFDISLKTLPPGINEAALQVILSSLDERLAHLEDENTMDRSIDQWLSAHHVTPTWLLFGALVTGSLLLLAWVCWRTLQTRGYRDQTRVPLTLQSLPEPATLAPLEQRHQEMLRSGNLWQTARSLVRPVWLQAGVKPAPPLAPLPCFRVKGSFWQRWSKRRRASFLWRLAFGEQPCRIRPGDWSEFLANLEQLKADLTTGAVQVRPTA